MTGRPPAQRTDRSVTADERDALTRVADLTSRLPELIASERARRGTSQEACADQLGVGRSTWIRWETGQRFPQGARLVAAVFRWLANDGSQK